MCGWDEGDIQINEHYWLGLDSEWYQGNKKKCDGSTVIWC